VVIVVLVAALLTVCDTLVEVLAL
jgi:hypothetical protein